MATRYFHGSMLFARQVAMREYRIAPALAADALKFFRKLYAIEKEAQESDLSFEARYRLRLEKAPPVLEAL